MVDAGIRCSGEGARAGAAGPRWSCGGPPEREEASAIAAALGDAGRLAPPRLLRQMAALIARVQLFVAPDCLGRTSRARAAGVPTLGVFGSTSPKLDATFGAAPHRACRRGNVAAGPAAGSGARGAALAARRRAPGTLSIRPRIPARIVILDGRAMEVALVRSHAGARPRSPLAREPGRRPRSGGRESLLRELLVRQPAERTQLVTRRNRQRARVRSRVPRADPPRAALADAREAPARWIRRRHLTWVTPPGARTRRGLRIPGGDSRARE